jgi:hypothetical protein
MIEGSGIVILKEKEFADVSKFNISASMDVIIEKADRNYYILRGDDNIIDKIDIKEDNGEFVVNTTSSFSTKVGLSLHIYTKNISALSVNGSIDVKLKNLNENRLDIIASGAIDISSNRSFVKEISIYADGTVGIGFEKLVSETSSLKLFGVGEVVINSATEPEMRIDGVYEVENKYSVK